ncbi:DUF1127 domain-containing protein [Aurantimonas sp. HBX-1]|uniref:DUF1127 domain-containing protein n=1 Tax=Aurantimonas sp. HBX-1 TaxID=2906072 RepID=UPI001F304A9D|nr:DUF1127 domain-containing protein [Aurantimonas sp. HBX-1]UIJ71517.1 DUF1127 domain-containing protein [Aurantimonas sp. HBX-1]
MSDISMTRYGRRAPISIQPARALAVVWFQRHRQRTALASLDDRLLADVGLSRDTARGECRKPFWHA